MADPVPIKALEAEALEEIGRAGTLQELREARARYLGRKGSISLRLRAVGRLEPAQRAEAGQAVNAAKRRVELRAQRRRTELEGESRARALSERRLDATLPAAARPRGALHPVTRIERDMAEFFAGLGFEIEDGPEVETEYNNFDALNIPADHPSRDLQDTFFVEGGHVLRTHTSPVQIRAMTGREPPFRFIAPGRVYRCDSDGTHSPLFHQIEAFCVDEDVTMADLKGVLYAFARHVFGDVELRFRAHYFPFTEPSAEIDFRWGERWLEWGGCGMIHPRVLENCGIDAARWRGFAFGMGIDRAAMDRYGIPNIHMLFDGDARLLEQIR